MITPSCGISTPMTTLDYLGAYDDEKKGHFKQLKRDNELLHIDLDAICIQQESIRIQQEAIRTQQEAVRLDSKKQDVEIKEIRAKLLVLENLSKIEGLVKEEKRKEIATTPVQTKSDCNKITASKCLAISLAVLVAYMIHHRGGFSQLSSFVKEGLEIENKRFKWMLGCLLGKSQTGASVLTQAHSRL